MSSFIESLNAGSPSWILFGTALAAQTCVLFVLLLALDLLLRRHVRAALCHAFWLLFLVKLVLPPSWAFPTGAGFWLARQTVGSAPAATATVRTEPDSAVTAVSHTTAAGTESRPPARRQVSLRLSSWLVLAWWAGALGLFGCFAGRLIQLRRVVARSVRAPESLQRLLDGCRAQLGVRTLLHIRLSTDVRSPALCGLLQPVILLPTNLANDLGASGLRAVLLHELIHLQRGDLLIQSLQALLQIGYWWHPLVWAANRRIRLAREEAVDERVMRELGDDAEHYPSTLLELAKAAAPVRFAGLRLLGILDSGGGLRQRIQRMLESTPPARPRLGWTGLLWTLLLGAMVLPMRGQVRLQPQTPPADRQAPATLPGQRPPPVQSNANGQENPAADPSSKVVAAVYDALYDPQHSSRQPKPVLGQVEVEAVLGAADGSKALVLDQAVRILQKTGYVPGSIIGLDSWFMATYGKMGAQMIENASLVIAGRSNSLHGVVDFYEPPAVDQKRRDEINPLTRQIKTLEELQNLFTPANPQVVRQQQRVAELRARFRSQGFRSRAFRVEPDLFLRNLELRRGETIRAASDDPMEIFLDLLKGAGVDSAPPNQQFFNRETGTIVMWNSAEGLAAAERVILGLNQPDGRPSSYAPPAGTNPGILAEATILQATDAAFTRLRLGQPPPVGQQIGDFWRLSPEDLNAVRNRTRAEGMAMLSRPRIQSSPGVTARLFVGRPAKESVSVELVPYLTREQLELTVLVQTTGHFSPDHPADWPNQAGWTNIALHGRISLKEGEGVVMRARHPGPNPTNNLVVLLTARVVPQ